MIQTKVQLGEQWTIAQLEVETDCHIRYGYYGSLEDCEHAVVFLNGRSEYIEKYDYLPEDLGLPPHWVLLTLDHRGQGSSSGVRAHIDHYRTFVKDASMVIKHTIGNQPFHLFAHSMGGLIALWGVLNGHFSPINLHLMSPLLGIWHLLPMSALRVGAESMCLAGKQLDRTIGHNPTPEPFINNKLTNDAERYNEIIKSPYGFFPITYGWLRATLSAIEDIHSAGLMNNLSCPTHLSIAQDDQIVNPEAAITWAQKAEHMGLAVTHELFQAKHELLSAENPIYHRMLEKMRAICGLPL